MSNAVLAGAVQGLEVERFEWISVTDARVVLRLVGSSSMSDLQEVLASSRLTASSGTGAAEDRDEAWDARPVYQDVASHHGERPGELRWSCAFGASRELLEQRVSFHLKLEGLDPIALPVPVARAPRHDPAPPPIVFTGELLDRPRASGVVVFEGAARRVSRVALGVVGGAGAGLLLWGAVFLLEGGSSGTGASGSDTARATADAQSASIATDPAVLTATSAAAFVPPGDSLVAQARTRHVPIYSSAHASVAHRTLSNPNADGAPLVFLVAQQGQDRLRVWLPTRPNLSQGWIPRRDVDLALDAYRLTVHLGRHALTVRRQGKIIKRYRVGVGRRAVTPTPYGLYYITELLRQSNPKGIYGPYAFGLSAHSNVLHEFDGGNGQIGIHGTNQPWAVGTDVSHGCIRVRNDVITRLSRILPLGTPVQIAP